QHHPGFGVDDDGDWEWFVTRRREFDRRSRPAEHVGWLHRASRSSEVVAVPAAQRRTLDDLVVRPAPGRRGLGELGRHVSAIEPDPHRRLADDCARSPVEELAPDEIATLHDTARTLRDPDRTNPGNVCAPAPVLAVRAVVLLILVARAAVVRALALAVFRDLSQVHDARDRQLW